MFKRVEWENNTDMLTELQQVGVEASTVYSITKQLKKMVIGKVDKEDTRLYVICPQMMAHLLTLHRMREVFKLHCRPYNVGQTNSTYHSTD